MIEAMKQALEALEDVGVLTDREWQAVHKNKANELRQAIREHAMREVQRLGQEIEQEPVAWIYEDELPEGYPYDAMFDKSRVIDGVRMFPVNVAPQRTWVGLTDEEIDDLWESTASYYNTHDFARAIEAKLKEKNT